MMKDANYNILFFYIRFGIKGIKSSERFSFFLQSDVDIARSAEHRLGSVRETVVATDDTREILEAKLTLRATRTEPTSVAVAVLGRRGRATIVDARALNTAVRVVQALLLKFAPRAVVEAVAPAPAQQITSVTATVLPVVLLITNLSAERL